MTPGFLIFFFVAATWSAHGIDRPIVMYEMTKDACELDRQTFLADQDAKNASNPPGLWQPVGASPCQMLISVTGAKNS